MSVRHTNLNAARRERHISHTSRRHLQCVGDVSGQITLRRQSVLLCGSNRVEITTENNTSKNRATAARGSDCASRRTCDACASRRQAGGGGCG